MDSFGDPTLHYNSLSDFTCNQTSGPQNSHNQRKIFIFERSSPTQACMIHAGGVKRGKRGYWFIHAATWNFHTHAATQSPTGEYKTPNSLSLCVEYVLPDCTILHICSDICWCCAREPTVIDNANTKHNYVQFVSSFLYSIKSPRMLFRAVC